MPLPWAEAVQLSAQINGGPVLPVFEVDSLLCSIIALFHTCLLLAFGVCMYHAHCTHLVPVHVSLRGWTLKRRMRAADLFGCNCLTNVGEKGGKCVDMEKKWGVI